MPPNSGLESEIFDVARYSRPRIKRRSRSKSASSSSCCSRETTPKPEYLHRQKSLENVQEGPRIVGFKEAPHFLQFNPFILQGYRVNLCKITCLKSLFWWTNETLNAWTHIIGWIYFACFTIQEIYGISREASWEDRMLMTIILTCFQICMLMSAGYHVFCCHSEKSYHCWLSYDLCGISFSLFGIYFSGIYYAFWCDASWRNFYLVMITAMFITALVVQTTPRFLGDEYSAFRLVFFITWSAFGFVPCLHWVYQNGGFSAPVFDLVSRIGIMYLICALALFFYITKIPEIWLPGYVDYIGSSHQWWHIIIFYAFYHWHSTNIYYASFRDYHGCFELNTNFTYA